MTLIQQQVRAVFAKLPEAIRDVVTSDDINDRIDAIADKQALDDNQKSALIRATIRLLIGVTKPANFVVSVSDELEIAQDTATLLAQGINRDIFSPLKDALRAVHAKPGGVVKLDPSLVTCLPGQMSKQAAAGNRAPGNAPVGNILEQKLTGSFRIKEDDVLSVGSLASNGASSPRLVVPPPPQVARPTFTPPAHHPVEPASTDPYRSHAL